MEGWAQELSERQPFSFWKSVYVKNAPEARPEITSKESGMSLLQRLIEENEPHTENARYILALMLERKRVLAPTSVKETEQGRMMFYENKKTGEAFVIRDPELRLDEVANVQEEVATLLGFGSTVAEPPKPAPVEEKSPAPEPEVAAENPEPQEAIAEEPAAAEPIDPEQVPAEPLESDEPHAASEPETAEETHEELHPGV